jgi:hypothetical protein
MTPLGLTPRARMASSFPSTYVAYDVLDIPSDREFAEATGSIPSVLFLDKQYIWVESYVGIPSDDKAFIHASGNTPLVGSTLWLGYDKSKLPADRAKGTIPAGSMPAFLIGPSGIA